ncbi:hypothetical protein BV97_03519 [Novosphingobium resinovorum]|jgi:hypothetical protein|uniref:Uncharacterized protein n=1 Tax=Novosphingobium resinovorum TaxID=158500 RepID=A0A031JVN0_9SPHN|nr:hypothetical protein BV97_03519 [Novosphingobium resinovorum]
MARLTIREPGDLPETVVPQPDGVLPGAASVTRHEEGAHASAVNGTSTFKGSEDI